MGLDSEALDKLLKDLEECLRSNSPKETNKEDE